MENLNDRFEYSRLIRKGYKLYAQLSDRDFDALIGVLKKNHALVRTEIISSVSGIGNKLAYLGDFWFHTDGTFLSMPPKWVVIRMIACEDGGGIELMDSFNFPRTILKKSIVMEVIQNIYIRQHKPNPKKV